MKAFARDVDGVRLEGGLFGHKQELNLKYLLSLDERALLRPYYMEAGLCSNEFEPEVQHLGWEGPYSQVHGHFLGHWLSGAARLYCQTGDPRLKGKADYLVAELARCQRENGGQWVGSIPEKYLERIAGGNYVWAPQYVLHKTMMGLIDMARFTKNAQALAVAENMADWLSAWSSGFDGERFQDILEYETGGMMECVADLYALTGKLRDLDLMRRYYRSRLFERLIQGEDVLTNLHANTTIPEVHGVCRTYEVTGEVRWKEIALRYWEEAVEKRGTYVTGGQTMGEVWTPKGDMGARLGRYNQEHCTVFNMIRLAEYLYRWTGEARFQHYIELNLQNGVAAQGYWSATPHCVADRHEERELVCYFLPLDQGSQKRWGSATEHFWCCHGTLVQAHAYVNRLIYHRCGDTLRVDQYIPSSFQEKGLSVRLATDPMRAFVHRPGCFGYSLSVDAGGDTITIALRLPQWLVGEPDLSLSHASMDQQLRQDATMHSEIPAPAAPREPLAFVRQDGYALIRHPWRGEVVHVCFPAELTAHPLPGSGLTAFRYGPLALCALTGEAEPLAKEDFLPWGEREWGNWIDRWRARTRRGGAITFLPIQEVRNEIYTVYFPEDRAPHVLQ